MLNSLTSPGMIAASLASLRENGTFIEVGKRGIWSANRISQVRTAALCMPQSELVPARVDHLQKRLAGTTRRQEAHRGS